MNDMNTLEELFRGLRKGLEKAKPSKRQAVITKAVAALNLLTKLLRPTQRELTEELLTNKSAMRIRELYSGNKKLFDLASMARELGLKLQKPSMDHILIGYYFPTDRLDELKKKFERIVENDPNAALKRTFQEWRGMLRTLGSEEDIAGRIRRLVQSDGTDKIREFAKHLITKDLSTNKRLPKNASEDKLVRALAARIWHEKMQSRAQEGRYV